MIFFDCEVFEKLWLFVFISPATNKKAVIYNDIDQLKNFYESNANRIFVGYNNRSYDNYILKGALLGLDVKKLNDHIISGEKAFTFSPLFNKVSLNSFDIMTERKGLKELEGHMGHSIEESTVDFNLNRELTESEIQEVIKYCIHDVEETIEVFKYRLEEFTSQRDLVKMFNMPCVWLGKTKAQLTAKILKAVRGKPFNDEFDIIIPKNLKISKYRDIIDWYRNPVNHDYKNKLEIEVGKVPSIFAWGGLHGALENYIQEGKFLNVDVSSFYPQIMIEYDTLSRNVLNKNDYVKIRDLRLQYKKEKNPMANPLKIVLNGTFGASKYEYSELYDRKSANNTCVTGQLLLLDLIEHLEGNCEFIQYNTDGLLLKYNSDSDLQLIKTICTEWENRTKMTLEYDHYVKVIQKDVNNYIIVDTKGKYKSKGSYVKSLNPLSYDMPIVNKSIINYFVNGITPEETIGKCKYLIEFQKIIKVSNLFMGAEYDGKHIPGKVFRVFASTDKSAATLTKIKEYKSHKISYVPINCFIDNSNIIGKSIDNQLDVQYYIDIANSRIKDFEGK